MLIDFHTHCFPEKIAEKAINKLSFSSGGLVPYTNGTLSDTKKVMMRENVDKAVVLSIATNEKQQTSVNDFAASINSDNIISFGSVFPDAPNALEELERIKAMGLKGVKLHPEFQHFFVDDEKMKPIYKKISSLGLICVFHAGIDTGYFPPYHATPKRIYNALKWFSSPVVAAHFGGIGYFEDVLDKLVGLPIYFDTAFGYASVPKPIAMEIINKHGADKILFGSDLPWQHAGMIKRLLETLELSENEKEMIYHKNAEKLLNI